ncbi:alpha/beta fold hydrolase [Variovorax sp. J22P168]|uniref:alpha/beta fold hydrolase n=1 Tax=Variovorax jilinensis TaxID=3053513 RepID=UPI0025779198|nr:alpha/beta fold hydrolase [Variovorax sp. J22P168]MDM0015304.1 alpha/beta fold hydrolase [Variovorax sp. J22P168]
MKTSASLAEIAWRTPEEREFIARNVRFHSGETLPELRLGYTVLGNPKGAPVLVLHGTGGTGRGMLSPEFGGELFGPGQALDAATHFIVLPDAIGHGRSSKPSDGLRTGFPRYGYEDMVDAQHRLVTEGLGLHRLRLVLGTSMGGMHAWLWGVRHPAVMDALVPLSSQPAPMSGRNWLLRRVMADAIRNDPQWQAGQYTAQPPGARAAWEAFNVATNGGTLAIDKAAPDREAADRWLAALRARAFDTDANDLLYQYEAAHDYDPSPGLDRLRAHVLAVVSADDERNPQETGALERAIGRLQDTSLFVVPASANTCGHGTVRFAKWWSEELLKFLRSVPTA